MVSTTIYLAPQHLASSIKTTSKRSFNTNITDHSISAELVPGDRSTDILLRGRIKRELPIYKFVPGRTSEGIQGPFYYAQAIDQEEEDRPQTFFQRYWVKDTHYQEKGPVFLVVGGEVDAEAAVPRLLGENSVSERLARKNGGMMVLLEHRYFGKSFPVEDLSEKNLRYLKITQVLGDIEQFALRGLNGKFEELRPGRKARVPWILIGSGYAGGIVHWELARDHGLFLAGYSLSGMVHATLDFSEYWRDVAKGMPPECADNVGRAVLFFDDTIESRDPGRMIDLRDALGLQQIIHFDDVASVLSAGIRTLNKPRKESSLTMFCEALSDGAHERDAIGGILREWGVYNEQKYGNDTNEKWTTYDRNVPTYTDIRLSPVSPRVFRWLKCMRLGWFQTAPQRPHRIVSLQLNLDREERICKNYFPGKYRRGIDPQVERTNSEYGPPDKWPKRAVYLNEENDPYHGVTVLAHLQNEFEVKGRMAIVDTSGITVVTKEDQEIYDEEGDKYIKKWLNVWYRENPPVY